MSQDGHKQRLSSSRRSSTNADRFPDFMDVVEIGRGGMGVVYKARHRQNGHFVVLKTMITADERQLKRFRREAEALAQIRHHNIVSIKSVGQLHDEHYFAMEFIDGENLRDRVSARLSKDGRPPDIQWSVDIARAVASGLSLCHEKGIVHRDVKPDNIVIGPGGRPVLVDFGLVKQLQSDAEKSVQQLTQTGQMLGTPGFMPPEQLEFKGEYGRIGPASDVWSLGATLYYCLCGQQPFGNLPFSAWCFAMIENSPAPVHTMNPFVPLWLSELCDQCLTRDPRQRPTMKDVRKRLERAVSEKKKRQRSSLVLGALFALVIVLLAYLISLDRTAPVLELESSALLNTGKAATLIRGQVIDRNPYAVILQKKSYRVEESGRFEIPVLSLPQGKHALSLRAVDRSGNVSEAQSVLLTIDREPPTLKFQSKDFQDGFLKLDGLISEDDCELKINGQEVRVIARQFRFDIPLSGLTKDITIDLKDPAGLRTVCQAENIFVIRRSGTRLKSLRQAFQKAPIGATILLFPGLHHCPPRITRNVEIIGLGAPDSVKLKLDRGLKMSYGLSVKLRRLTLTSDKRDVKAVIELKEAALSLDNCIVSCEGERMIRASSGLRAGGPAILKMKGTVVRRTFGGCVVLENSKLIAENCRFLDVGPSLYAPRYFGRAFVELRNNSQGRLRSCLFQKSRDRGVFVSQSSGEFKDCDFDANVNEGVHAIDQAKVQFEQCRFARNNYAGVAVQSRSTGFFANCQMNFNGQTNGSHHRRSGLTILQNSEVDIRQSELNKNLGFGIVVEESRLNVYRCQFRGNGEGRLRKVKSVVTRNERKTD